jgi:hypothetical protein
MRSIDVEFPASDGGRCDDSTAQGSVGTHSERDYR